MPAVLTLTTMVVPQVRSRRKMSAEAFLSPTTRLSAKEVKATKRPSGLTAAPPELELPTVAVGLTLTSATSSVGSAAGAGGGRRGAGRRAGRRGAAPPPQPQAGASAGQVLSWRQLQQLFGSPAVM